MINHSINIINKLTNQSYNMIVSSLRSDLEMLNQLCHRTKVKCKSRKEILSFIEFLWSWKCIKLTFHLNPHQGKTIESFKHIICAPIWQSKLLLGSAKPNFIRARFVLTWHLQSSIHILAVFNIRSFIKITEIWVLQYHKFQFRIQNEVRNATPNFSLMISFSLTRPI